MPQSNAVPPFLVSLDGRIFKIYGLPKIHKEDCPLRSTVSFVGSPTYNLSTFLVELLRPLSNGNLLSVIKSQGLAANVWAQLLGDDDVTVTASFNVAVLFRNVTFGLGIDVVEKCLHGDCALERCTSLVVEDIVILLRFCLKQSYFTFSTSFTKRFKETQFRNCF